MPRKLTNEEFLQRLKDENILYIPLDEYVDMHTEIRWLCYKNPKHIFSAKPYLVIQKQVGCVYCSGRKVFVGETDLWTTHPEIAKALKNFEDGSKYTYGNGVKVDWICPDCGFVVKNKSINYMSYYGFSCPRCSDGISYPNKFMTSVLCQLHIDFVPEYIFDGSMYRYDFYIPSINTIIEMHGKQHYEECKYYYSSYLEIHENDIAKYNFAKNKGVDNYIVIDCKESNEKYISNNILSSAMSELFNLDNINWQDCARFSLTSLVKICADMYNEGKSVKEISNIVKHAESSIRRWLKSGTSVGMCNYDSSVYIEKSKKKVICLETMQIYESIKATRKDGFNKSCVANCCHGRQEHHKGLHWMFYKDYLLTNKE